MASISLPTRTANMISASTGDAACQKLECISTGGTINSIFPGQADGSTCDTGKCCLKGHCVDDCASTTEPPSADCSTTGLLPTTVPVGCEDTPSYSFFLNSQIVTCDIVAKEHPYFCYTHYEVPTKCCKTCHKNGIVQPTQHIIRAIPDQMLSDCANEWSADTCSAKSSQCDAFDVRQNCAKACGCLCNDMATNCGEYVVNCEKDVDSMRTFCPKTCGYCINTVSQQCVDTDTPKCEAWKDYCDREPVISTNCPLTCKRCGDVDGQWGPWSQWKPCDVTCGTGKKSRVRLCNNPYTRDGGAPCDGTDVEYTPCSEPAC